MVALYGHLYAFGYAFRVLTIIQSVALGKPDGGCQIMEATWKKDESTGPQPTPSWAMYAEAANKFRSFAEAFMEHVHLLTEARSAYQAAMSASTELRRRLDAGDQTLRSLMSQLEQVVNDHLSEPLVDRKKPELVRDENTRTNSQAPDTWKAFP